MLKIRLATVAIMVAFFGLVSVSSASAQYAPCSVSLDVNPINLHGSGDVEVHAESDVPGNWSASNDFDGQTANGSGDTFDFSFTFPEGRRSDRRDDMSSWSGTTRSRAIRAPRSGCTPRATTTTMMTMATARRTRRRTALCPTPAVPTRASSAPASPCCFIGGGAVYNFRGAGTKTRPDGRSDLMSISSGMWTSVRSTANRGFVHAGQALGR